MANLTNHINFNTSGGGGGDVTAGDAIRIDAGNEVNVKFDNTSITLNGDGELQATLPIHCIEDYPATVEGEIIINGCGCTAGELYRAVDDSDYYPENTKYFYIGQTQTKILSPETGKRFYFKRTEQKNAYTVTKVHDYKTNYNRYSDIYDDEVLCSADILDSVVAEIMTGSHNDHVLNLVLHNTIRTDSYYKSHGGFKYTSPIDGTTCYGQALHSSAELTEAGWTTNQVTRFENSIVTAIQSIDPTILNVTQFFSKYSVINSIAEEYHLYGHNIIIADNSTNKPVMYAGVSFSSSNDYECVYYRLNKIVDTFTLFRTYPKSGFAMMMYNGDGSGDDATYFSNYEYVLETTNQILSSGTIRTSSSAKGSCNIGGDDVCSYTVSCNGSDNNILTSLMSTTDTAMGEPGGLVWEPVANCPEPEPEISIEAGDAIRIDNGTEVNVKFDGTTITLNDNGELQATGGGSDCCDSIVPKVCVSSESPTEEGELVINTCDPGAGYIYKSVLKAAIPSGTRQLVVTQERYNPTLPVYKDNFPYQYISYATGERKTFTVLKLAKASDTSSQRFIYYWFPTSLYQLSDRTLFQKIQTNAAGILTTESHIRRAPIDMMQPSVMLPTNGHWLTETEINSITTIGTADFITRFDYFLDNINRSALKTATVAGLMNEYDLFGVIKSGGFFSNDTFAQQTMAFLAWSKKDLKRVGFMDIRAGTSGSTKTIKWDGYKIITENITCEQFQDDDGRYVYVQPGSYYLSSVSGNNVSYSMDTVYLFDGDNPIGVFLGDRNSGSGHTNELVIGYGTTTTDKGQELVRERVQENNNQTIPNAANVAYNHPVSNIINDVQTGLDSLYNFLHPKGLAEGTYVLKATVSSTGTTRVSWNLI